MEKYFFKVNSYKGTFEKLKTSPFVTVTVYYAFYSK